MPYELKTRVAGLAILALATGCTSKSTPISNPFTSADRVPPPTLRTDAGSAPSYPPATYGALAPPAAGAPLPAITPYSGGPAAYGSPAFAPAPGGTFAPVAPAPGTATPTYAPPAGAVSDAGDTIAIPADGGSLRFASPSDAELARRGGPATATASRPATRRPATAGGWIAGSAPVRSAQVAGGTRVRLPGGALPSEPVSIAAIGGPQAVPIAPLEPSPGGPRPGEPQPLRVATPPGSTGWR